MNSGEDKAAFMEYEAHGYGDARITAWADITEWLNPTETPVEEPEETEEKAAVKEFLRERFGRMRGMPPVTEEEEEEEPQQQRNYPHFRFGLGMKLPTGKHDLDDSQGVVLPARYQPGWGVASPVIGAGCYHRFADLTLTATLMYEVSGGENSEHYKRGDVIRFDSNAYYPLSRKYALVGGLGYSLTWIAQDDRWGGVRVNGTKGTFHSLNLTGIAGLYRGLMAALIIKVPFGSSSAISEKNLDFQYTLSVRYSF